MNESVFQFLHTELLDAEYTGADERLRQLRAIDGYLKAAKKLRESLGRQGRGGMYDSIPREIDQFDVDCARVSP